eukprot:COSAG01_NODE_70_length_28755_cov_34.709067_26_plen_167_part_00
MTRAVEVAAPALVARVAGAPRWRPPGTPSPSREEARPWLPLPHPLLHDSLMMPRATRSLDPRRRLGWRSRIHLLTQIRGNQRGRSLRRPPYRISRVRDGLGWHAPPFLAVDRAAEHQPSSRARSRAATPQSSGRTRSCGHGGVLQDTHGLGRRTLCYGACSRRISG